MEAGGLKSSGNIFCDIVACQRYENIIKKNNNPRRIRQTNYFYNSKYVSRTFQNNPHNSSLSRLSLLVSSHREQFKLSKVQELEQK